MKYLVFICFFNTGVYESMTIKEWNISNFESMININYLGAVRVLKPLLVIWKTKKRIKSYFKCKFVKLFWITLWCGAYSAFKSVLVNLGQSIQPELSKKNIYLQIINHGFVKQD